MNSSTSTLRFGRRECPEWGHSAVMMRGFVFSGMGAAAARRFEDLILNDRSDASERQDDRP